MRSLVLFISLLIANVSLGQELTDKAQQILEILKKGESQLSEGDANYLNSRLDRILWTLEDAGLELEQPFQLRLIGDTLEVYVEGDKIVSWSKHQNYQIVGNVIGLLDSEGEFGAWNTAGTRIVPAWTKTVSYKLTHDYIALLDSDGIFDAYHTNGEGTFIDNWRDTVKYEAGLRYILLLDSDGIFQGYNLKGDELIRQENVTDIQLRNNNEARYLQGGVWKNFPLH